MPYKHHPDIEPTPIPDDTSLWRFMSLSKFLNLLSSSELYFVQLPKLREQDPFEGTLPLPNIAFNKAITTDEDFARRAYRIPAGDSLPFNWRQIPFDGISIIAFTFYCSCWHVKEHESAFLWSNYANMNEGIAIRTTVKRLKTALSKSEKEINFGLMQYKDYSIEAISQLNVMHRYYTKRLSFQPEAEFRAGLSHMLEGVGISEACMVANPPGLAVNIGSPDDLIESVFISPTASAWLQDTLLNVTKRLGLNLSFAPSSILSRPFE